MKIIIHGAKGKMGKEIEKLALADKSFEILAYVDSGFEGNEAPYFSSIENMNIAADVLVDFSNASCLKNILNYAKKYSCKLVLGSTGYSDEDYKLIDKYSKDLAIFCSSNMSLGISAIKLLAKQAQSILGEEYDIEIIEKHHKHKKDAPSGTAKMLYDSLNNNNKAIYGREGNDCLRTKGEIGIHSVRGGSIVGEHEIAFYGTEDEIYIKHVAKNRALFAKGALDAVKFIFYKENGRFNTEDLVKYKLKLNL